MIGCFVNGTDTGVGKTLVSAALLYALARHHQRVVGMKPVAAGVVRAGDAWSSEDALALRAASTIEVPAELDNPVLLPDPLSPHIAAQRAGVQIAIPHTGPATSNSQRRPTPSWSRARAAFMCRWVTTRRAPILRKRSRCPWCWWWACAWAA